MTLGVGVDSVQVARLRKAIERWGRDFLERLFTERELLYCLSHANPYPRLSARFAAKEAALKALHSRGGWKWRDMEVERAESGKPSIVLTGEARKWARQRGAVELQVSLTHDDDRATAVVIAVGKRK